MEKFGLPAKEKAALEIVDRWIDKRVIYTDTDWVRRFCCLVFRNKGELLAERCYATLKLIDKLIGPLAQRMSGAIVEKMLVKLKSLVGA